MITIYDWFCYELSITERYRLIKEAGFDGVLLWWSDLLERGDYRKGAQLARDAGLYIENVHAPFQIQDDLWSDNLDGANTIACYLDIIKDCSEFVIPTAVIHLPEDSKPHNELGLDRIKRLADRAESSGVNVALENIRNYNNLSYILNHVDSKYIGLCYDSCHSYNFTPEHDVLSEFGERMIALHLHDYNSDLNHQIPLDGVIEWDKEMKRIYEVGYTGSIAIEAMNWNYKDLSAEEFLAKAYGSAVKLEEEMNKDILMK